MKKDIFIGIFWWVAIVAVIALGLFAIGMTVYVWVVYGSLPPDQVPSWAHWWILGGR